MSLKHSSLASMPPLAVTPQDLSHCHCAEFCLEFTRLGQWLAQTSVHTLGPPLLC